MFQIQIIIKGKSSKTGKKERLMVNFCLKIQYKNATM